MRTSALSIPPLTAIHELSDDCLSAGSLLVFEDSFPEEMTNDELEPAALEVQATLANSADILSEDTLLWDAKRTSETVGEQQDASRLIDPLSEDSKPQRSTVEAALITSDSTSGQDLEDNDASMETSVDEGATSTPNLSDENGNETRKSYEIVEDRSDGHVKEQSVLETIDPSFNCDLETAAPKPENEQPDIILAPHTIFSDEWKESSLIAQAGQDESANASDVGQEIVSSTNELSENQEISCSSDEIASESDSSSFSQTPVHKASSEDIETISIHIPKDGTFDESDYPQLSSASLKRVQDAITLGKKSGRMPKSIIVKRERVRRVVRKGGIIKSTPRTSSVFGSLLNPLKNLWNGLVGRTGSASSRNSPDMEI
ncbi:hypothetical protein HDU83_004816 [Entophlyctis luteolus]|nr:hypothetical protein HDU83_004816 [Entophlyctis luteolus]